MEAAAACRPGTEARPESGEDDGASLPRTAHGGGTTELLTLTGQLLDADQRLCAGETRRPARAAAAGRSPSRSGAERGRRGDSGSSPGGGRGGLRREIRKAARRPSHLFFDCAVGREVWNEIKLITRVRVSHIYF
jgi:hypothetical protein